MNFEDFLNQYKEKIHNDLIFVGAVQCESCKRHFKPSDITKYNGMDYCNYCLEIELFKNEEEKK